MKQFETTPGKDVDEKKIRNRIPELVDKIGKIQHILYAEGTRALLVILQGMDASGKDGAIKNVFESATPVGLQVTSFKKPTQTELEHDFLWRIHSAVPAKGLIGIFNRSQYEDILVPTVEKYIPAEIIDKRYEQINEFETNLEASGTTVLKFFLSVSPETQKKRLEERMTNPEKFWKHKDSDWTVREKWDEYMNVYQEIFKRCNDVQWNIIPADKNWYKEYLIAQKVLEALEKINPAYPPLVTNMIVK